MAAHEAVTAFAGIVTFDGTAIDQQTENSISRALTARSNGNTVTRRAPGALFAQRTSSTAAGMHGEQRTVVGRDGRTLFAALACLDNYEELAAALGLTPAEAAHTQEAVLLLRMIERWGDAGIARCLGAFAFALWDADARRLTLGRDCLGNRPLFYHTGTHFVAFATTLGALLALPGVPRAIDELALAHFMAFNIGEARQTFYRGIERVPSRTLATIDLTGVRHRYYWTPSLDAPPAFKREEDYLERARELLDQAVAAAIRATPHVAISASGGLDSSAIAATAARLGIAKKITCYVGVPLSGTEIDVGLFRYLDERAKVESLARMHPALDLRFIAPESTHPIEEDYTRLFVRTNLPILGPSDLGWFSYLYDAVLQAGHRVLLVGLAGNFGLTWWGYFSLLALLRAGQWGAFAHEWRATARESRRGLVRTFAGNVLMPAAPARLRRLIYRLRGRDPDSVAHYSALNPALIDELDLARQWQAQGFDPWFGPRGWNAVRHRAYYLFDNNQLGRDLRGTFHEIHGFDMRDPLADRRLLEFVLAVPEPMFRQNGVPRSFARRVLADRLPRDILDERRRGVQAPTWFRSLDARRKDIASDIERLEASPLARRLIDVPRLKRLMMQWPKDEHAAEQRLEDYKFTLTRGVHVGRFLRWVEGGNE
jgi:asparagine synthase (glutamine-hydrolysing)